MVMQRTVLLLSVILCFAVVSVPEVGVAAEDGAIYIKADGTVGGTDKIQRVGDVYTFTGNIEGSISVERNNIIIDGAGYKLQPKDDITGVDIRERNNVTVKNLTIEGFSGRCGVLLIDAVNCRIIQNTITSNLNGIEMTGMSSLNRIVENRVQNNSVGMEIYSIDPGSGNVISENTVTDNYAGIQVRNFLNTNVSGNIFTSNSWGLGLGLGSGSIARNNVMNDNTYGFRSFNVPAVDVDVDTSNTVNGKPIIYWVNQHNKTVPADACYVALIVCSGITVENLNLAGNLEGVFLGSTTNSTVVDNRISNNMNGISFDASSNNTVTGNTITDNENGVSLRWDSLNNTIIGNAISLSNSTGIYIAESESNSIIGNNITCSGRGVYTEYCGVNIFHHNNFINNTQQWYDIAFTPWPITLQFSVSVWDDGMEGNYWDTYTSSDNDGDGIGDTPYILNENNQDNFPLIVPVDISAIPEFPSWIILPLFLAATLVAIFYSKRLRACLRNF
jgi:parallel beta-helix repeat protein